jgi:hypothetical protein
MPCSFYKAPPRFDLSATPRRHRYLCDPFRNKVGHEFGAGSLLGHLLLRAGGLIYNATAVPDNEGSKTRNQAISAHSTDTRRNQA